MLLRGRSVTIWEIYKYVVEHPLRKGGGKSQSILRELEGV
jgi:hypothetical protein